ncbi:MAG: DUF4199 domain-containing protein [Opitutus sp.]|nr:DUF4199 domain-containing protein [Opitutus sp.]
MKTYLTYGFYMALGSALLVLAVFFLGLHSDPTKLSLAQWVQGCGGLGIAIACIIFGTKARRAEVPVTEEFAYGSALGSGVMITLFAALFGIVTTYLYTAVINPNFTEVTMQAQAAAFEAKGVPTDKIEQIQKITAAMMKPPIQAAFGFVFGMLFGTIISLITAAFLKRAASDEPPAMA